jgi:hypothetical protein
MHTNQTIIFTMIAVAMDLPRQLIWLMLKLASVVTIGLITLLDYMG